MENILPLIFLLYTTHSFGQPIQEIRSHYQVVANQIDLCQKRNGNCPLYQNTLELNKGDLQWTGVGNYSKKAEFWYTYDPTHCDECSENGLSTLLKVSADESGSTYTSLSEFLYKDGKLIFCYRKNEDEQGLEEQRHYFNDNSLIRYQLNEEVLEPSKADDWLVKVVTNQSKVFQTIFLNSF